MTVAVTATEAVEAPMMKPDRFGNWRRAHDAALVSLGADFYVAMSLRGETLVMSSTAHDMARLAFERGADAAISTIAAKYRRPPEDVVEDFEQLRQRLVAAGMIERPTGLQSRLQMIAVRLSARAGALMVRCMHSPKGKAAAALWCARVVLCSGNFALILREWCAAQTIGERATNEEVDSTLANLGNSFGMVAFTADCKVQSLATFAVLKQFGRSPSLKIGLMGPPVRAHAWCEVEGAPVLYDAEATLVLTPVFEFR